MMSRAYNFAAGPATLPVEVLQRIKNELFDWRATRVSALEIGHRTSEFQDMLNQLQDKLRSVLDIPLNYKILFLPGGAQGQFSAIPLNLTKQNKNVDYLVTGIWSKRAFDYASKIASVNIVTNASPTSIPEAANWILNPNAAYAYYCTNETINGICFPETPQVNNNVPLIADATSSILTMPIDIKKHGIVFASSQKNLGTAGITLVIIRDDLLDLALESVPEVLNYSLQAQNNSCLNTIPTFPVYVMDLMLDWVIENGGILKMMETNLKNSKKLYQCIDESKFYINMVDKKYRSPVTIPFDLQNEELLELFLDKTSEAGLLYLKGHRLGGGARASLYNALPEAGVDKLVEFMQKFAKSNADVSII